MLATAFVLLAAAACGNTPPDAAATRGSAVVYGTDDRREAFASQQPSWLLDVAETRLLALGDAAQIRRAANGEVALDAPTLRQRYGVCDGERFAEQPSFALCSAVLVSSQHVLTAAHCLRALPLEQLVGVSRFYNEPSGDQHALSVADLHTFSRVVAADEYWEYAWLELTEPVPNVSIPPFGRAEDGDPIVSPQHGEGLPAKVVTSTAVRVDAPFFLSTLDAFGGASGAPVFTRTGELVGVFTAGAPDFERTVDDCLRTSTRADAREAGRERALDIDFPVHALCAVADDAPLCEKFNRDRVVSGCSTAGAQRAAGRPHDALVVVLLVLGWVGRRRWDANLR